MFGHGEQPSIGMVFQQANLMPWRTVIENIKLPLEVENVDDIKARATAQEMIELVGLQGFEDSLPRDLSGGMAQRVAIARALIHDPDLLLRTHVDRTLAHLAKATKDCDYGDALDQRVIVSCRPCPGLNTASWQSEIGFEGGPTTSAS
jgi:ABC-type nitrate/sulfonate/bicarbonate transport system ATPase subunit